MNEESIEILKDTLLWLGVAGGLITVIRGLYNAFTHLFRPFNLDIAVPGRIYFVFDSADSIPRFQLEFKLTNYNHYPVIFDRSRVLLSRKNKDKLNYEWSMFFSYSEDRNEVVSDGQAFPVTIKSMDSEDIRIEYDLLNSVEGNWFWEGGSEITLTLLVENLHKRLGKVLCRKSVFFKVNDFDEFVVALNDQERNDGPFRIEKKIDFKRGALDGASS